MEKVALIIRRKRGGGGKGFQKNGLPVFVVHADAIRQIQDMLPSIADTRDPALIDGESGTGKELLARLIVSKAKGEQKSIKIDCAELRPDRIANSTLLQVVDMGSRADR